MLDNKLHAGTNFIFSTNGFRKNETKTPSGNAN